MRTKLLLAVIILTVMFGSLHGGNGNLAASFIDETVGARALGLGGAYTVLTGDPSAMIWNPAGLRSQDAESALLAEHSQLMNLFGYSFAGFNSRISPDYTLGLGIFHAGDKVMSENIFYLALAAEGAQLNRITSLTAIPENMLDLGLTVKYYYSSFGKNSGTDFFDHQGNHRVSGSAHGFGIDLGAQLEVTPQDHVGTSIKNIFSHVRWSSENEAGTAHGSYNERLPFKWTFGYARKHDQWRLAIDINKSLLSDTEDIISLGGEYDLSPEFSVRAGASQELVTFDNQKLMAGLGFNLKTADFPEMQFSLSYLVHYQWQNYNSVMVSVLMPLSK